jgi:hypothetical protein
MKTKYKKMLRECRETRRWASDYVTNPSRHNYYMINHGKIKILNLVIKDYEKIEEQINTAIDKLGQALYNSDFHYNGIIEKDRIQDAMQTLMSISQAYINLKQK